MNIFPLDIQYLISEFFLKKNKKEIILLYTYPEYSHEELIGYYYPEKILQEKIEFGYCLNRIIAKCGNIRVMIFLFENGCPWSEYTFQNAAYHGNLDNMKCLLENGCPWSEYTFSYAAEHGNLDNMKWLLEKECPWDSDT